jgi:uncharacterized protein YggE
MLIVAAVASARAQEPAPVAPTIVTSGDAIVRRLPGRRYVTLAVESRARNPRDAQRANADAMSAVQKQLATAGIPKDAMRTLGLGLHRNSTTPTAGASRRDFVARNTLDVRIDDVSRAGEIADAVVQGGATALEGIRFDLKDRARRRARSASARRSPMRAAAPKRLPRAPADRSTAS